MKKEFSIAYTRDVEGLLIDALAPVENGGGFRAISFRAGRIDYLCQLSERASAIVLQSGIAIPVALSYADLKKVVYEADMETGASIDLTLVTGPAAKDAMMPKLARSFNEEARPLQIRALVRKRRGSATAEWRFNEAMIKNFQQESTEKSRCRKSVWMKLEVKGPFGDQQVMLDMPYDDFISMLSTARQQDKDVLDLYEAFAKNPNKYGSKP